MTTTPDPREAELDGYRALIPGWDGHGAWTIKPEAVATAKALLALLPGWQVTPTVPGGVGFRVARAGVEVELDIGPDGGLDGALLTLPDGRMLELSRQGAPT